MIYVRRMGRPPSPAPPQRRMDMDMDAMDAMATPPGMTDCNGDERSGKRAGSLSLLARSVSNTFCDALSPVGRRIEALKRIEELA